MKNAPVHAIGAGEGLGGFMKNVGVVGGGLMGSGIAEVSARSGHDVVVVESSDAAAKAAFGRLETSLERAAAKAKIDSVQDVLDRIRVVTELDASERPRGRGRGDRRGRGRQGRVV